MALSLVQLQAFRDALVSAISRGVRQLTHEGKTISYHGVAEMEVALARLDSEISSVTTTSTRPRQIRMATSKGL